MAAALVGPAAVHPAYPLDAGQAEPEPAGVARPRAVEPREGLDGFLAQMFGDAGAVVGDLDFNVSLAAAQPHLDLAPEAQRIAEQVEKRALHCDALDRSEERGVGKECVGPCRSRGLPYHTKTHNRDIV